MSTWLLVKQRVELGAERTKTPRLHLHEFTVGADDIDHEPPNRHLNLVTRRGQYRLDGSVQRSLSQHTDAGHALEVKGDPGGLPVGSQNATVPLAAVSR